MFKQVQRRLLLSYLVVLAGVLLVFAGVVYGIFSQSLYAQLDERLVLMARTIALENEDGLSKFGETVNLGVTDDLGATSERIILKKGALVQWLNQTGTLIQQRGQLVLADQPLQANAFQSQTWPERAMIYTLAVRNDEERQHLSYVRVALALTAQEQLLNRLLWGLGGGIAAALGVSAIGGIWLTQQAIAPIEISYRQLQQFTADASHELRSPLTAIKTNVQIALQYPTQLSPQEVQETFSQIASATDQMTTLVNDLLFLTRSDATQTSLLIEEPVDIHKILFSLVTQLLPIAQHKQISLNYDHTKSVVVMGDPSQLLRLFRNLMDNALQYTPAHGQITVMVSSTDQTVAVTIHDTGMGITAEQLPQIFKRFWRADRARARHSGGMGLGLAIAQTIADAHRGKISVVSQPGQGSTFTVNLPV